MSEKHAFEALEQCKRCCGNGEIITDWDTYLHPPPDAPADAGTADCPDCGGTGALSQDPGHD